MPNKILSANINVQRGILTTLTEGQQIMWDNLLILSCGVT